MGLKSAAMIKSPNDEKYGLFIAHLKSAREAQGLTIRQLAELIEEDNSVISRIETRDRKLTVQEFVQYCLALKLDPSEIVKLLL